MKHSSPLMVLAMCLLFGGTGVFAQEDSSFVEGTGTLFDIPYSDYFDVLVTTDEVVNAYLSSVPEVISLELSSAEGAASTRVTICELEPSASYYKYEEGAQSSENIMTDQNGCYTYIQDLSQTSTVHISHTILP